MARYQTFALSAVILAIVYYTITRILTYHRARLFARSHGCRPVPRVPQREHIIGYDLYKEQADAHAAKFLLTYLRDLFLRYGNTFQTTIMGDKFINTMEPENVKTILATKFEDFGIGQRKAAFGPLLGDGIFTSDGSAWEHSRVCFTIYNQAQDPKVEA